MGDLLGLTHIDAGDMLVLVLGLPYLFILTGRLVPYRQHKIILDLLAQSEAARERALLALGRVGDALDAGTKIVDAALSPPEERDREPRT